MRWATRAVSNPAAEVGVFVDQRDAEWSTGEVQQMQSHHRAAEARADDRHIVLEVGSIFGHGVTMFRSSLLVGGLSASSSTLSASLSSCNPEKASEMDSAIVPALAVTRFFATPHQKAAGADLELPTMQDKAARYVRAALVPKLWFGNALIWGTLFPLGLTKREQSSPEGRRSQTRVWERGSGDKIWSQASGYLLGDT